MLLRNRFASNHPTERNITSIITTKLLTIDVRWNDQQLIIIKDYNRSVIESQIKTSSYLITIVL